MNHECTMDFFKVLLHLPANRQSPLMKMRLNKKVCIQLNLLSMMWEGFVGWQGMAGVDRWNREEDLVPGEVEDTQESDERGS